MTLKEHLSTIESYLVENGQEKTTALLYKLFLLCEMIRDHAGNGKREQDSESYDKVAAYVNNISLSGRNIDAIKAFKCDRSIDKLLEEDFLEEFYEQLNLAASSLGREFDHFQPRELTNLVSSLCGETEGKLIYNPYAGLASYAGVFKVGNRYYGEEYDLVTWSIGVLKMWVERCNSVHYIQGDSIKPGWDMKFDVVVSTPPVGNIPGRSISYVEDLLERTDMLLHDAGTMVLISTLPDFRKWYVNYPEIAEMLDTVITLPEKVLYWTAPAPVVVKIRKDRCKGDLVTFVDGSAFCYSGGRGRFIIDVDGLLQCMESSDSKCVKRVSADDVISLVPIEGSLLSNDVAIKTLLVGGDSEREYLKDKLKLEKCEEPIRWLGENPGKVDAVLLEHAEKLDPFDVVDICHFDLPVFFLVESRLEMNERMGSRANLLGDRCFEYGTEYDLLVKMRKEVEDRKSPMWHIRKQYINELRAANSIQGLKSSGKEFNLPDCLERTLSILSSGDEMDCGNKLRTIRDDYILSVLEDFGFIPRTGVNFNRGAQLDFLADRFYSPNGKDYAYFLKKSIGSPGVFQMLRASKVILNASSHGFGLYRRNMMMSVMHSILGALCDLEEMIDRGLFDRAVDCAERDYYIKVEKKGVKNEVVCQLPDNNDYWYAGNIHLDSRTCEKAGIRVGDCVDVDKPSFENKPVINDAVQIYLYSNHIKKSN